MESKNFDYHINKLLNSPVYSMSLGSKELFHSNFWAFLIKTDEFRELIKAFFNDFDLAKYKSIEREDRHRDLTIYDIDGNEFVIENKIKSYPNEHQLKEYSKKGHFYKGTITGIKEPPFSVEKWTFISYSQIASKLREINKSKSSYLSDLVNDYCDILDSINALMDMSLKEKDGVLSYWSPNIKKLYDVNLMDVFRKNKADDFVKSGFGNLNIKYKNLAKTKPNLRFYVERSFNNGKATLSFGFKKYNINEEEQETIGIQIEDNQFRLYKWNRNMTADEIFNEYSIREWFDPTYDLKTNRKINGVSTKMRMKNKYCKYGKNWIYQYFDTWLDGREINYQEYKVLTSLIELYLKKAFELID